ncbi:MAG TPA: hypothetical protein VI703_04015 [Anaerolineales bacterium]|jgi:hypothetical protein|nr:hypothetical protein [Anaerolineales bacterium]
MDIRLPIKAMGLFYAGNTGWFLRRIIWIGSQHTARHTLIAYEMDNALASHSQTPGGEQRESCVLTQKTESGRGIKKDYRGRIRAFRGSPGNGAGGFGDPPVTQPSLQFVRDSLEQSNKGSRLLNSSELLQ